MSYSCPTCKDGELTVDTRDLALEEGEIVQILENGTPIISKIVCSNTECSSNAAATEGDVAAESDDTPETPVTRGKICGKNGCPKPAGHMYRCKTKAV